MKIRTIKYDYIASHVLLALCAFAFSYYMQFEFILLKAAVAYVILFFARKHTNGSSFSWTECLMSVLFSFLLAGSLVLGYHIHVENHYTGLMDSNYITKYSVWDWFALFLMMYGFYVLFRFLLSLNRGTEGVVLEVDPVRKSRKRVILINTVILFLCWLPYLITYYPGYVFGDSLASIQQALGNQPLDNAHPILYTMLIRFCIWLGQLSQDKLTTGCAIYCLIQMLYMAFGLAILLTWLERVFRMKRYLIYAITACFALSPYIAQYGIAMWKDPIFSTTVLLLTIQIAEMLYSSLFIKKKRIKQDKKHQTACQGGGNGIRLLLLLFLLIFSRNNGIYIVAALICFAVVFSILVKKQQTYTTLLGLCLLALLVSIFITGPVYRQVGISQKNQKVESYGIFLQQMARVVAVNGRLSPEDKKYMASMLPLHQYAAVYTPCCVDQLKWNRNFKKEPLEDGFFRTYFSILRKNPRICFEAWMLQTYGYWTLNSSAVNNLDGNILYGVPRILNPKYTDAAELGIHFKTVDQDAWNVKVFPYLARCVPLSYIHWLLILLLFLSIRRKDWSSIMILGASLGLLSTLLVASPINYWPRYGLAEQFLLPLYLVLLLRLLGNPKMGKWIQSSDSRTER